MNSIRFSQNVSLFRLYCCDGKDYFVDVQYRRIRSRSNLLIAIAVVQKHSSLLDHYWNMCKYFDSDARSRIWKLDEIHLGLLRHWSLFLRRRRRLRHLDHRFRLHSLECLFFHRSSMLEESLLRLIFY